MSHKSAPNRLPGRYEASPLLPLEEDDEPPSYSKGEDDESEEEAPPPPPHKDPTKISSLDFERVVNEYSIQATRERFFPGELPGGDSEASTRIRDSIRQRRGDSERPTPTGCFPKKKKISRGRNATRWALSAIVALFTGLTTNVIVACTRTIVIWRKHTMDWMTHEEEESVSAHAVFAGFAFINLTLAVAASALCVYVAPEGTGSGIPQVKAYLNGVRVKKFTSWPLFLVKILGTILSVSSALAVGMEGPLVHIGAIVGSSFTKLSSVLSRLLTQPLTYHMLGRWAQPLWTFTTTNLAHFSVDAERRDLISIGASVGFAASFGAPIGGLLFILDDVSSYFSKDMFLRTLVANAIGTFCLAIQSGSLSNYSVINLGTYIEPHDNNVLNRFEEVPLYLLVGVVGGVLGGLFCTSFRFLKTHVTDRLSTSRLKLFQVALLSLITSILVFYIPMMSWTCQKTSPDDATSTEHLDNVDFYAFSQGRQFFCRGGQVNEMATIVFGSRDDAIKRILSDPSGFQQETLWTVGILFYALMTITYGSILPSGIFTPTVLIGASLGGAAGMAFQDMFGDEITPATYALLGVAAMLAGIQRSTVSISVILVEGTGQIKVLLPVIMVVLVARYVAQQIHLQGIYETSMDMMHYPYLDHEDKHRYDIFEVRDIMSTPVEVIGPLEKASHLVRMLRTVSHNGFPVVDPKTKKLLGLVRRDQIVALIECGVFAETEKFLDEAPGGMSLASSISDHSTLSTPKAGSTKSPLMHWAYHITDDRYDYLRKRNRSPNIGHDEDEYDRHEWLLNIHDTLRTLPEDLRLEMEADLVPVAGDDSMPPLQQVLTTTHPGVPPPRGHSRTSSLGSANSHNAAPQGNAKVGVNEQGNLVITSLNPEARNEWVNVAAVMNRGCFSVTEYLPVSKARFLFTRLGLRHVIVLGGDSGGEVVGIFTRGNLMPSYIQERTGISF